MDTTEITPTDQLADTLSGPLAVTFEDTQDTPVYEPLPGEARLWGDTDVIGLYDAETDMTAVVDTLQGHPLL